jgi:hypothetical protein
VPFVDRLAVQHSEQPLFGIKPIPTTRSVNTALELPAIDFDFATIDIGPANDRSTNTLIAAAFVPGDRSRVFLAGRATKSTQTACPRHTFEMFIDSGADALRSQFLPDNRRETITGANMLVPRKVETPSAYWRSVDLGNSDVQFATFLLRQPLLTQHTLRWIEEAIEVIGSETPDDDGFVRLLKSPGGLHHCILKRILGRPTNG